MIECEPFCRLLLQPSRPPLRCASLRASPALFPTAERSRTRPQRREANYLQALPLKKKKKKFTLTYTDATTSTDSHRLRPDRGSLLGITCQRGWSGALWIFKVLHFWSFSLIYFNISSLTNLKQDLGPSSWTHLCVFFLLRRTCLRRKHAHRTRGGRFPLKSAHRFTNHPVRGRQCVTGVWPDFFMGFYATNFVSGRSRRSA